MSALQLISRLRDLGVQVTADGDHLRVNAARGVLTDELLEALSQHKQELLELLGAHPGQNGVTPMRRVSRSGPMPLSFAQERLWFLDQLTPGDVSYNVPQPVRLSGPLDVSALRGALGAIIDRHEALRTCFPSVEGEPRQVVVDRIDLPLEVERLTGTPERREELARERAREETGRPFDLATGPLVRARLLQLAEQEHVLLLTLHHITTDGWSMNVLYGELAALYHAFMNGQPSPLPPLSVQYADYADWQRRHLDGETLQQHLAWWTPRLAGAETLDFPTDRPRPAVQSMAGGRQRSVVPAHVLLNLKGLAREEHASLFMVTLAAFQTLLYRYAGQDDIVVGTPVANRDRPDVEGLIGFFANTLVLRGDLSGTPTFRTLLRQVRGTALDAYDHQMLPFEILVNALQPERDLSRNPIFQVFFAQLNIDPTHHDAERSAGPTPHLDGLRTTPFQHAKTTTHFDLELNVTESSAGLVTGFIYSRDLFDDVTIERLARHYHALLEAIGHDPDQTIDRLPIMDRDERAELLSGRIRPAGRVQIGTCDLTVSELLSPVAFERADAVAVVGVGSSLTYRQVEARSNQLAHHLRRLGVGRGSRVGLCVDRSPAMVVGLLGVLKVGAAYVPLDPALPEQRLQYMIDDAGVSALLTTAAVLEQTPLFAASTERRTIPVIDLNAETLHRELSEPPAPAFGPDDVAYVIYTSGSTGRPKGVEVLHRGVVNFLQSMAQEPGIDSADVLLAVTTLSFDIAVLELLLPLAVGGRVVIADSAAVSDGESLQRLLKEHAITVMQATPATWQLLIQTGWSPSRPIKMLCGGEALPRSLADALLERGGELWNMYGPTETTIWSATAQVERGRPGRVSIGRPIAGTQLYVLDGSGQPVPDGAVGELWIGGVGLARGYLNRPALTAERFVADPFGAEHGGRLYRTGDRVRYDNAGHLHFLGRVDHQVKLRGFRIELGEIERALTEHPRVEQSAVLLEGGGGGDGRLVAYVVGGADATPKLRRHLAVTLPEYMIPGVFVALEAMPLSPAGKVDRRQLATISPEPMGERETVAPRNPVEAAAAATFAEVLRHQTVGVHEDFFELGGHSLLAIRLVSRLRTRFQVELPLSAVFEASTVAGLAERIEAERSVGDAPAPLPRVQPASRAQRLPLSFSQRRLWFLDQLGAGTAYNILRPLRYQGHLDERLVGRALTAIADRHEVLRTSFPDEAGRPYQQIAAALEVPLQIVDLSSLSRDEAEAETNRCAGEDLRQPFDLARGPLLRAMLVRMEGGDALLLTIHHIICDGWSLQLLGTEIAEHYRSFHDGDEPQLPPLPVQYADFAVWQIRWVDDDLLRPQLEYWTGQLGGELPVLDLPTDRPRPAVQTFSGASRRFEFSSALCDSIRSLTRAHGATTAMTLLAAFKVLLARYTGQGDIVVGSPVAGRTRTELENLIGFFVNSVVLRTDCSGNPTFETVLNRVHQVAVEAYDHQDLPFERLVEEIDPERDLGHNPLFQVVFAMQTQDGPVTAVDAAGATTPLDAGTGFRSYSTDVTVTRTDIEMHLLEQAGQLRGWLVYNTDLFDAATIDRMIGHYLRILQEVTADPTVPIDTLSLLGDQERQQLLVELNRTDASYPRDRCIHELIEDRAAETPDAAAVVFGDRRLSYDQLNEAANQLAHTLRDMGVTRGTLVGLCVERCPEMIVGLLGILKAGGAYVPIDPAYPDHRVSFMLEDSEAPVLVTQSRVLESLPRFRGQTLCVDGDAAMIERAPRTNPTLVTAPGDLAYVIYTSGSTGQPKAALLQHRGLCSLSEEQRRAFGVRPESRVLQFSSLSFDASTFEVMMALPKGACLYLGTKEELQPGPELLEFLRRHAISIVTLPPTALAALPEASLPALQTITVAGEACSGELVSRWAPGRRFFNLYGPTETTIWATMAELRAGEPVHVGRPIGNTQTYVLDRNLQPVPVGVPGELHIGGVGLARGYHRRPRLTAERFIAHPTRRGQRLYKTGDLVRYRADGTLQFLGRIDHQVKLRGYRIELGEIEAVLEKHPAVREAVALVREDTPGDRRIVAYVVDVGSSHGGEMSAADEQWQSGLVSHWQTLYDQTYEEASAPTERTFNIAGWNSSYTGEPLPEGEMRQWVDRTVERILATGPDRVLEIGCGAGLLLFQVALRCSRYVGTDFSTAALDYVAGQLGDGHDDAAQVVALQQARADELGVASEEEFDTVILNSVAQYFPSPQYLATVLEGAASRIGGRGRIFVGDVRSLPLLHAFHASVQLAAAEPTLECNRLRQRIAHHLNQDQELVVDPAFFFALAHRLPRITAVEVLPKQGAYDNELSRFRYDVVMHIGGEPPIPPPTQWLDWQRDGLTLSSLETRLRDQPGVELGCTAVPNSRTQRHALAWALIEQPEGPKTVAALRLAIEEGINETPGVDPQSLWTLGEALGLAVSISWSAGRRDGSYDVVLRPAGVTTAPVAFPTPATASSSDFTGLTNNPLRGRLLRQLVPDLREHARAALPEYMVPASYVLLDRLPLTPSGKVDRPGLPAPDTLRSDLAAAYAAPQSPAETALVEVWAQVLSLGQVGIHDNFFELGGDSIQSVQVVAAAREAGWHITARDMFEHQTVAELAVVAEPVSSSAVSNHDQGPVVGEVGLTPIQHWFFEQEQAQRHHFNQAVLLERRPSLDPEHVQEVLDGLIAHHDALRTRFHADDNGWHQRVVEPGESVTLERFDLISIPAADRPAFIEAHCRQIQSSLDLTSGPILLAGLFTADDEACDRLLLAIHHLAVDGVSWRILLEDLERGLQQQRSGKPPQFPPRTTSIRQWERTLRAYAQTPALEQEAAFWLDQPWDRVAPLPLDADLRGAPTNTVGSAESVSVGLSESQTRDLLQEVPAVYGTRINDVLLTALTRAIAKWTGHATLLVDLEGHGRARQFDEVDLSRTVGWFTSIHPMLLRLPGPWNPRSALKSLKEQLRSVPEDGIGYGLARYLCQEASIADRLRRCPQAQVSFNYLGQLDQTWGREAAFQRSGIPIGPSRGPQNQRHHRLEINGAVTDRRLSVTWTYCPGYHRPETIAAVAGDFITALEELIQHCTTRAGGEYTPSDFAELNVSQAELDDLLAEVEGGSE